MNYQSSETNSSRLGGYFEIEKKEQTVKELEQALQNPEIWQDRARAQATAERLSLLSGEVKKWHSLAQAVKSNLELSKELLQFSDPELEVEVKKKTSELEAEYQQLEFLVFYAGDYDRRGAIITISAGAGGTDAQDWAEILLTMLLRFSEHKGFRARLVDRQNGQEAGIKSATFEVIGPYAYGIFKSESGVHRLVRISPYDAEKMRHTSFAMVDVIPDLGDLADIELKDDDLRIDVYRSSGHGGQSVNTTDSAVRIVHIPTNLTVTCQNERSQQQNKQTALKILKSRLGQRQIEEREKTERRIRGAVKSAEWGSQIRSYVLHPYKLVKDHRTGLETQNVDAVLHGELDEFSESYVRWLVQSTNK
ncbi:MAG: peptide chain release factor 2 [Candidatus Komeilibacteria bacterium]|nr:peptide chain release factor 2 [Candidatus Komeilibacteria bacterium]